MEFVCCFFSPATRIFVGCPHYLPLLFILIAGTNPSHKLPTDVKSMVDTKLDPEVERALMTKQTSNAMVRNMRVGREKKK